MTPPFLPGLFRVEVASAAYERAGCRDLRRQVFRAEPGLAGETDAVVGTARIHEAAPGPWWGSRLAVRSAEVGAVTARGRAAGMIGTLDASRVARAARGPEAAVVWDVSASRVIGWGRRDARPDGPRGDAESPCASRS